MKCFFLAGIMIVMMSCGNSTPDAQKATGNPENPAGPSDSIQVAPTEGTKSPGTIQPTAATTDDLYSQKGYPRVKYKNGTMSPEVSTPRDFRQSDVNVYNGERKLNYFTATPDYIKTSFFGNDYLSIHDDSGDNGDTYRYYEGQGLKIVFNLTQNQLRYVSVTSDYYTLERGGKVGMGSAEIQRRYRGGFMYHHYIDPTTVRDEFYYVLPRTNDTASNTLFDGFVFYFTEGIVDAVYLSGATFIE